MPTVSVIVPVYKAEDYLEQCVDSLVSQTYQDIEIILVDDGSPDRCGEYCDGYAKKYPIVRVIHQENQGISAARNAGMAQAHGEWLMFVDDDDWVEVNMIEAMLGKAKGQNCDICVFGYIMHKSETYEVKDFCELDGYTLKQEEKAVLYCNTFDTMGVGNRKSAAWCGAPWAKLYRRCFLADNNIAFNSRVMRAEDFLFNLYAIQNASKVMFFFFAYYHFRFNPYSYSLSLSSEIKNEFDFFLSEVKIFADKYYQNEGATIINVYVLHSLMVIIRHLYRKDPSNISILQETREIRKLLRQEPYNKAVQNVKTRYLKRKGRIKVWLFRAGLVLPYVFLVRVKNKFKKVCK
jgi:glycosyltransferase involved in cell wall biosynthesis